MSSNRLSKRKFDDDRDLNDEASNRPTPKMRKDKESQLLPAPLIPVQFFVRTMPISKTLVLHAHLHDTVEFVHRRIHSLTGIPVPNLRLIYNGRQLQPEQTLSQCSIVNDANLQLVGRMRSTPHHEAWQVIDAMVSPVFRLCKGESAPARSSKQVLSSLDKFVSMTSEKGTEKASGHLQIFLSSRAPTALVMLYLSPHVGNRDCADAAIRRFVAACRPELPRPTHALWAPVILEFCKLLTMVGHDLDPLYVVCRSCLGVMVGAVSLNGLQSKGLSLQEVLYFVRETGARLSHDLGEAAVMLSPGDVQDFAAFTRPVCQAIREEMGVVELPIGPDKLGMPRYGDDFRHLYGILNALLEKMEVCLRKVEETLALDVYELRRSHYLPILKELCNISRCFAGSEDKFWTKMRDWKVPISHLVVKYTKRDGDHTWLMKNKEVMEFESRRHLVLMMLSDLREDYDDVHEMLIDRSQLLSESFEYIGRAEVDALKSGLFIEFKSEEATGPGVLREWFFLVCQQIFNPENALFVACPNDRRRFFPNHVSEVHPRGIGLEYFRFAGRVIALALMHKLQVGIVFDRVFFLQLAGKKVSLEDIRDADPFMYNSCKKILELDAAEVDADALSLTFVREVEELGARTIVELCPGGKSITVNSRNRQEYVNRLIEHRFVESIKDQVQRFAKGFADMLCNSGLHQFFFQSLELQDLDWMLHGSEIAISVEDWMAHTDYNGFEETDPQITWFWKIIGGMSSEQKKVLLFFWTSLKCLPVEGFRGLASRLYICKSTEPLDRLPSSHTCFYQICFPPYPSMDVMQFCLNIITQEHFSCSFGTW